MARLGRRAFPLRGPLVGVDLSRADLGGKAVRGRVEMWRGVGRTYLLPPTATCGSPTSGSRTRAHAFTHGTSCRDVDSNSEPSGT
jgi:hypothetical protein